MKTDGKTNGPSIVWPDGKRIAVMLTFDFDAEYLSCLLYTSRCV